MVSAVFTALWPWSPTLPDASVKHWPFVAISSSFPGLYLTIRTLFGGTVYTDVGRLYSCFIHSYIFSLPLHPFSLPHSSPSLVSSPAAEPTPEEGEVHRKVATVLDRAPDILADLHGYKGAGEHIREVGNCHLS